MAEQIQKVNPLRAFELEIAKAKGIKDIIKSNFVQNRYIATFEGISGRKDGPQIYEQEAFAFIDLANNKPDILTCDPFSIVAGFIKASTYGLSFQGNDLSVYKRGVKQKDGTYKDVLVVEPQAHGKKRLIGAMSSVADVEEGVVVFKGDPFDHDARNHIVLKHIQAWPRPEATPENVVGAYCTIKYRDGTQRDIVIDANEIKKARAASKMSGGGELWQTHYGEAVKKTAYNRAFKVLWKKPKTDVFFEQYEGPDTEEVIDQQAQVVDDQKQVEQPQTKENFNPAVNEETGEVYPTEEVKEPKKSKKKSDDKPFI